MLAGAIKYASMLETQTVVIDATPAGEINAVAGPVLISLRAKEFVGDDIYLPPQTEHYDTKI